MRERVTIIGAGPGGYVAAIRAAQMGAEVTLLEKEGVGGTCLNWGCIPSKVLKNTAEMLHHFGRADEFGLTLQGEISLDYPSLLARKDRIVQDQAGGIRAILERRKVRFIEGTATLEGEHRVRVRRSGGGDLDVFWDKLILAVGSRPFSIPSFPFDGRRVLSSDHVFRLKRVPESLLIVGGGVIGCEFAMIFSAFGAKVTLVEALSRLLPLPSVDEACSKVLQREMKKQKIECLVNRTVERIEERAGKCRVSVVSPSLGKGSKDGGEEALIRDVDKVLVCVGRRPNTDGMGLETIGVETDERGWILCNERMEASVAGVFAIGDVLGPARPMLAHVASREGLTAAENALGGARTMGYDAVPSAVFTMPEVADVGLTENQARERGYNLRTDSVLFRSLGKPHVIGEIAGEAKLVSDTETGKILGVHIIGPGAGDLIAEATLALRKGCTVRDLADTIHAHPTLPEIMMELALKAADRPLHG